MNLIHESLSIYNELEQRQEEDNEVSSGTYSLPLFIWSNSIEKVTSLTREEDIKPSYIALINSVNNNLFGQHLSKDPTLFI